MTWGRKIRWPQAAAHRLGLQIHALNAQQRTSGREGFHGACGPQGRGLLVNPDLLFLNLRQKIVTAVAHQRVAAVYYSRDYAVVPSGVQSPFRRSDALRSVGLKLRIPNRTRHAFIRLLLHVALPTTFSRSRVGRLAGWVLKPPPPIFAHRSPM